MGVVMPQDGKFSPTILHTQIKAILRIFRKHCEQPQPHRQTFPVKWVQQINLNKSAKADARKKSSYLAHETVVLEYLEHRRKQRKRPAPEDDEMGPTAKRPRVEVPPHKQSSTTQKVHETDASSAPPLGAKSAPIRERGTLSQAGAKQTSSRGRIAGEGDRERGERETISALEAQLTEQHTQYTSVATQLEDTRVGVRSLELYLELAIAEKDLERVKFEKQMRDKQRELEQERDAVRTLELEEKLRRMEEVVKKLHSNARDLKSNIRVFARVRPVLLHKQHSTSANINCGDELAALETGLGELVVTDRGHASRFAFDKVFGPEATQQDLFDEVSILVQSVLRGQNLCVFAYGQSGSGKTWTIEGGESEEDAGLIPRVIEAILQATNELKTTGWKYEIEGQFLEVYKETISDLLGKHQQDAVRNEIKIDRNDRMTVTGAASIPITSPRQVGVLLERALARRAASSKGSFQRLSRTHSVFALKVKGENSLTGEKHRAILHIADLAGPEHGAGGKVEQSLGALEGVISALGMGKNGGHVPYNDSALTRLMQASLSASSKILMLCNVSPLAADLNQTLCNLKFAMKVNATEVGPRRGPE
ncbi:hypothetical protein IAT38_003366 [Cryptococcus sp. DSM 104549]